jgi:uncharacterized protein
MTTRILSATEARVLATLMEKARTVPDSYPLSLNSLLLGCNQKTSRDPVMALQEPQVQAALDSLCAVSLAFENSGARVLRYEHNFQRGMNVSEAQAVLLGLLMLRGPQTAGELRINADRWYKFDNIAAVETVLAQLQDTSGERGRSMVVQLSRSSGTREPRWMHLLCGDYEEKQPLAGVESAREATNLIALDGTSEIVLKLQERLAQLEARVQKLESDLGVG